MKTELKYGLILGFGICVYTAIDHLLGFYSTNIEAGQYGDIAITLLPVVVLYFAIKEKRKALGHMTILQGLKTGELVALISFPISAIGLWIYHHYINPGWLDFIIAHERAKMENAGLAADAIATRVNALQLGNSDVAQLLGGLIGTLVMAAIPSLIFSYALSRKRTP